MFYFLEVSRVNMNSPRYRWQENFISYKGMEDRCFIYCDTNASFVSVHQYLEGGVNKPCVVANGNVSGSGDAGSCLAISYEARGRGLTRGSSLIHAKKIIALFEKRSGYLLSFGSRKTGCH